MNSKRVILVISTWFLIVLTIILKCDSAKKDHSKRSKGRSCKPPCRVCAEWEDSCNLPARTTSEDAANRKLYFFVNPNTGFTTVRNRTTSPFPFQYRIVTNFTDTEEWWITRFMYYVLKLSLERERSNSKNGVTVYDIAEDKFGDEMRLSWQKQYKKFLNIDSAYRSNQLSVSNDKLQNTLAAMREVANEGISDSRFYEIQAVYSLGPNHPEFDIVYDAYLNWMEMLLEDVAMPEVSPLSATDKCAVFMDNRRDRSIPISIKHTMSMLGPEWALVIFHTHENEQFLRESLKFSKASFKEVVFRRMQKLSWDICSSIRASSLFYSTLPHSCQHVLIFESDAIMRKKTNLSQFTQENFPTVGAPWVWCAEQWCRYGGNGGATLRHREAMISITSEIRCDTYSCHSIDLYSETNSTVGYEYNTEDVFLARQFYEHREIYEDRMPTFDQQRQFAVETYYYHDPVWLHKAWDYMHPINAIELMATAFTHYQFKDSLMLGDDDIAGSNDSDKVGMKVAQHEQTGGTVIEAELTMEGTSVNGEQSNTLDTTASASQKRRGGRGSSKGQRGSGRAGRSRVQGRGGGDEHRRKGG